MLPSLLGSRSDTSFHERPQEDWLDDIDASAVLDAMADEDAVIRNAARGIMLTSSSLCSQDILGRQQTIQAAISGEKAMQELYLSLLSGIARYEEARKASQPGYARFAPMVGRVRAAAGMLDILLMLVGDISRRLRAPGHPFASRAMALYRLAFLDFFDDAFMKKARERQTEAASFSDGSCIDIGMKMGNGLKAADLVLRGVEPYQKKGRGKGNDGITLEAANLHMKATALRDAAVERVLHVLSAVNAQIAAMLVQLQTEVGFLVGCARLYHALVKIGVPLCYPEPYAPGEIVFHFDALADAGLALRTKDKPVGNSLSLDGKALVVVTGANQGGKSTFLRSVGLAQAMMQCGMFVTAQAYASSITSGLHAHFCRAEDGGMDSGKLDEELRRMDEIIRRVRPGAMLLMNESFASTTETEGAAIAEQITCALASFGVRVLFVTHLYSYASAMQKGDRAANAALLRAERNESGVRSFQIQPGVALPTSHGLDLFERVMGDM